MVRIWDPVTGAGLRQLDTGHPRGVGQVHIAPDGSFLVANGSGSVAFWVAAKNKLTTLRLEGNISSATLSNRDAVLFLGGPRGLLALHLIAV